jgi:hypothetical protein
MPTLDTVRQGSGHAPVMQCPRILLGQILCHSRLPIQPYCIFLPEWENSLWNMDWTHPFLVPPLQNWLLRIRSDPNTQSKDLLPIAAMHSDWPCSTREGVLTLGHRRWKYLQLLPCHLP